MIQANCRKMYRSAREAWGGKLGRQPRLKTPSKQHSCTPMRPHKRAESTTRATSFWRWEGRSDSRGERKALNQMHEGVTKQAALAASSAHPSTGLFDSLQHTLHTQRNALMHRPVFTSPSHRPTAHVRPPMAVTSSQLPSCCAPCAPPMHSCSGKLHASTHGCGCHA